jgi:hypothetical protein
VYLLVPIATEGERMRREWSPEDLIACWTLVGSATEHPAGQFSDHPWSISVGKAVRGMGAASNS